MFSLLLWGGPLLLRSLPERKLRLPERGCYNNTEKPIFLLFVGEGWRPWLCYGSNTSSVRLYTHL